MPKKIDLTGQRFGRLTVLRESSKRTKKGGLYWVCICGCSDKNIAVVASSNLISGDVQSCGCYQKETAKKTAEALRLRPKNMSSDKYRIMMLSDCYIRKILKRNTGINIEDITQEMIGIKREQLKTYRLMKRIKKEYNL